MDCSLPVSSVHGILQAKYWSGLPFPPGENGISSVFPTQGSDPGILRLLPGQADSLPLVPLGSWHGQYIYTSLCVLIKPLTSLDLSLLQSLKKKKKGLWIPLHWWLWVLMRFCKVTFLVRDTLLPSRLRVISSQMLICGSQYYSPTFTRNSMCRILFRICLFSASLALWVHKVTSKGSFLLHHKVESLNKTVILVVVFFRSCVFRDIRATKELLVCSGDCKMV